jgi:hypothetical protein
MTLKLPTVLLSTITSQAVKCSICNTRIYSYQMVFHIESQNYITHSTCERKERFCVIPKITAICWMQNIIDTIHIINRDYAVFVGTRATKELHEVLRYLKVAPAPKKKDVYKIKKARML